jgi:hypothetical protein
MLRCSDGSSRSPQQSALRNACVARTVDRRENQPKADSGDWLPKTSDVAIRSIAPCPSSHSADRYGSCNYLTEIASSRVYLDARSATVLARAADGEEAKRCPSNQKT